MRFMAYEKCVKNSGVCNVIPVNFERLGRKFFPVESMNQQTYTPGPWHVIDSDYGEGGETHKAICQSVENGGQIIADIVFNQEANARLIASVTKLLGVCERLRNHPGLNDSETSQLLNEVIAEAKGE